MSKQISVTEFIDKEMKEFSVANTIRSLPIIIDGLKTSQRKVLFGAIEYGKEEVVDRLAMSAAARTAYKMAGANLDGALVNMAKAYPGTNNIPYFDRDGQFGSIMEADASSSRYISAGVAKIISLIFRKEDNGILDYNYAGEERLEPKFFLPVIPMLLVNGAQGIGTGYATKVPNHDPKAIIAALRQLLDGLDHTPLSPWYNGYKGECGYYPNGRVYVRGVFERLNATTLRITEVPVGNFSKIYEKKTLMPLYAKGVITGWDNDTSEITGWDITVTFKRGELSKLTDAQVVDMLNLEDAWLPTLTAWNETGVIQPYRNANDILVFFFNYRLDRYEDRRQWLIKDMNARIKRLITRVLFIEYMVAADLNQNITSLKDGFRVKYKGLDVDDQQLDDLFKTPLSSITLDARERLNKQWESLKEQLAALESKDAIDLYREDLDELEAAL